MFDILVVDWSLLMCANGHVMMMMMPGVAGGVDKKNDEGGMNDWKECKVTHT